MPQSKHLKPLLGTHRIWSQLSTSARDKLSAQFRTESFTATTVLLPQGELPHQLGWILNGDVTLSDPDLTPGVFSLKPHFGWM